ncbi:MAG: hypothetical protein ACRDSZ_25325 [Pseudonocardiaceae bacterium]
MVATDITWRGPLISMPEIAEIAAVQRPVVTTWRRRHANFPSPAGTGGARPLFDAREVAEWLVTTGRADRQQVEPDLQMHTLAALRDALPAPDLVATTTALICLRHLDEDEPLSENNLQERAATVDPGDELLLSEITASPNHLVPLAHAVDGLVEGAWGCQGAFERIMAARQRLAMPQLYSSTLEPQAARLIAELSGARERSYHGLSVAMADPAAGSGDLLTAAVQTLEDRCTAVVVAGEEDSRLARLARRRLIVHGLAASDVAIRPTHDVGNPDVLVTQLPYCPGENRSATDVLDRIDDIALRLASGRTAVVLGPAEILAGALRPFSPDERARARLIGSGMVEAVIRLPGAVVPFRPGYETAIWVLTSAHSSPWRGRVLLGDVSDRPLTGDVVDALVSDVVTWRRAGYRPESHTRSFCGQADVADLVRHPQALAVRIAPSVMEVTTRVPATVARVTELEAALSRLGDPAATPRPPIRSGIAAAVTRRSGAVTLRALTIAGRVRIIPGIRLASEHLIAGGHHRVLGADELVGSSLIPGRSIDRAVLADHYPRATLTEPGDVVVTLTPAWGVHVDEDGYSVVAFPARTLRIHADHRDGLTPRVLAALLTVASSARAPGAVRSPRKLDDWEIQLPDPPTVQRLDAVLADFDARRRLAEDELHLIDDLSQIAVSGLADGRLAL